jgi:hypothetical protein
VAMALDDLRTEVSVFEPRDSDVLQAPASAHHADRYRGPRRLRGTDRSPRSRAVRHVRGRRLRPDGDAGAPRESGRDSGADRGLLQPGSARRGAAVPRAVEQRRAGNHQLALDVISGRHTWLAAGIIDPSAGDGPMVPSAETDRGESSCLRATTAGPGRQSDSAPTSSSSAGGARYEERLTVIGGIGGHALGLGKQVPRTSVRDQREQTEGETCLSQSHR